MALITGGMDQVVLAPAQRREAILQLIRSAHREFLLTVFRCDDFTIVDELAAAVRRGVRVRVLITQRARGWKNKLKDLAALLTSLGAEVVPYAKPLMKYHAKYFVADEKLALVTSLNCTRKCFESTCDFMLFTHDPEVITGLKDLFEFDCCATPAGTAPTLTTRLIVGPDHSRQRLIQILSDAASSIRIVDHRVRDAQILALLAEKERQGLKVQLIANAQTGGLISHGRMTVIDQKTAIIGSIHLSGPSLDLRREVAILTEEPGVVAELYDYFRSLATSNEAMVNRWAAPPTSPEDEDDDEEDE
jgi:cardiolipin synthase